MGDVMEDVEVNNTMKYMTLRKSEMESVFVVYEEKLQKKMEEKVM